MRLDSWRCSLRLVCVFLSLTFMSFCLRCLASFTGLPLFMSASRQQIIRSYRNLYRHGLHAVQYASPARYSVKALIENAYRTGKLAHFDNQKINNTLTFLHGAAKEKGLEHRILKTLLHTWWWENRNNKHHREYVRWRSSHELGIDDDCAIVNRLKLHKRSIN